MATIAMFNNKGGVGKTTLTCNISAYLAEMGYKVLVVDADHNDKNPDVSNLQ